MRGILLLTMVLAACSVQAPRRTPSEAMERSARMLRQLDRLEADLHNAEGENLTYAVLVERHGQAEQIACKVAEDHVADITRLQALQERKIELKRQARAAARRKKTVAQLKPGRIRS